MIAIIARMVRRSLEIFLVSAVIALPPLFCLAQGSLGRQADLERSITNTSLIVAEIRPKLFDDLPLAEHKIYEEIKFDVSSDDQTMNAWAYKRAGVRHVTLTEAVGREIKLNVDALLMEQAYHIPSFLGRYMNYVCTRYQVNKRRYAQGLSPERIESPYEFAHWSDRDLEHFYADADVNRARVIMVGGAFAFLLAHEVAHHVLGHEDEAKGDKEEQRRRESDADAWAINLLVRKQISPVAGIVPMLFFYYTDQNSVENEQFSDHPADARRLLAMYEGLEMRLPSFRSSIVASGQDYETVRKQVQTSIALVKSEIGER